MSAQLTRLVAGALVLLSLGGCCCDVLVFLPIREVSASPAEAPPALSRSLLYDGARAAAGDQVVD